MTALFVAKREIEIDPDKRESARVRVTQKVVDQRGRVRKGRPHPRKPMMRRPAAVVWLAWIQLGAFALRFVDLQPQYELSLPICHIGNFYCFGE